MNPKAGFAIWGRAALFFAIISSLGWFSNIEPGRRFVVEPVTEVSVLASRSLINLFGGNTHSEGTLLYGPTGVLDIRDGCNGIIAMILFAGAVLAFEATAVAKLVGLAIGIPVIWMINLFRIVSLHVVSVVAPSQLEFFHIYFFQTFIIICVVVLWYVWAMHGQRRVERVAQPAPASPAAERDAAPPQIP